MTSTREGLRLRRLREDAPHRTYTTAEVAQHSTHLDSWIILNSKVYDVSAFDSHPGGYSILEQCAGKDATDPFRVNHPEHVLPQLEKFYLGEVSDVPEPNAAMKDFHELDAHFKASGLYETRLGYYGWMGLWLASIFAVVLLPFVGVVPQSWPWMVLSSVALGFFWQQFAFIGHDLGHNAIFHDRLNKDYYGSLLVVLFFGVSGQWWKRNHNCHHVVTNSINGDPDIQYLPVFMLDSRMLAGFQSLYHKTRFVYDKVAHHLVAYQHILYIPIMMLARHNLYVQSWIFVISGKDVRRRGIEALVLALYAFWVLELLVRVEDSNKAWAWWFISHSVCGLLHVQITLSHFSMECFETQKDTVHRSSGDDFLRHQCATSLDVDCHPYLDWFHGGLQFQVVHHLWPQLPRHNLRYVRNKYFIPLCEKHGIEYNELPFHSAVGKTLLHMKEQAMMAAMTPPSKSMIVQAMNLDG